MEGISKIRPNETLLPILEAWSIPKIRPHSWTYFDKLSESSSKSKAAAWDQENEWRAMGTAPWVEGNEGQPPVLGRMEPIKPFPTTV